MRVIHSILQQYTLGNIQDITLITAGVENENYQVKTHINTYVVRLYSLNHSIRGLRLKHQIERELEFIERAKEVGIQTPHVVKNNQEELVTSIQIDSIERFITVFTFIEGSNLKAFSTKASKQVGQVVSQLFEAGQSFQDNDLNMTNDIMSRAFQSYNNLLSKNLAIPHPIHNLFEQLQSQKPIILARGLSQGLVHGDLTLENMLFDVQDNLTAILDFDDYRYSYLLEEAVTALLHNLHSIEENILRSGNYEIFIEEIQQVTLKTELQDLGYFLRLRFIHDVAHYLMAGYRDLVDELLQDVQIQTYILDI